MWNIDSRWTTWIDIGINRCQSFLSVPLVHCGLIFSALAKFNFRWNCCMHAQDRGWQFAFKKVSSFFLRLLLSICNDLLFFFEQFSHTIFPVTSHLRNNIIEWTWSFSTVGKVETAGDIDDVISCHFIALKMSYFHYCPKIFHRNTIISSSRPFTLQNLICL